MTWTTALSDLRNKLSDGSTDKLSWRKPVLGISNGTNKTFKTFEKRRLTNFTAPAGVEGAYVNDAMSTVASDDPVSGEFTFTTAPTEGARITASYYFQWFIDSQLTTFLQNASYFLGFGADYTQIPGGLQPAALFNAAADAYLELSVRFARMLSEGYRLEDLPTEALEKSVKGYSDLANQNRKDAGAYRKAYYTRQDQNEAPIFGAVMGHQRNVEPNA